MRLFLIASSFAFLLAAHSARADPLIEVRVVVVTTFEIGADTGDQPGEFQSWVEQFPLPVEFAFPQGYRHLRYDPERHVLGIVTGEGTAHAAASIMALGMDPRFDLTHAYWVLAGIAGVDPTQASVGSASWAQWVVDGDLAYEIDEREIPPGWTTGYVPLGRSSPYQPPKPPDVSINGHQVYHLNPGLVRWAYQQTANISLPDDATLEQVRAPYTNYPNAQKPPFVLRGDMLASSTFWVGARLNQWAEQWESYWTNGQATFVMSAEEDSGFLQALTFLSRAGRADISRALDLRTASDYTAPPPGETAAQLLASDNNGGLSGYVKSLNAAYTVGSQVVRELADCWDSSCRDAIPSAP